MRRVYGHIKDKVDARDLIYRVEQSPSTLPTAIDLRPHCPPAYDQGDLGSCTANSLAGAIEYDQIKQGLPAFIPSRLFIYYCERALEGTINQDAGAMIRDGIKVVVTNGAPPEAEWPYDISKFTQKPPQQAYNDAKKNLVTKYMSLSQSLNILKSCLAEGYPFTLGIQIYSKFESPAVAKTGMVSLPAPQERYLGGHAVLCVGYDDSKQVFIVRNSWGTNWGVDGYFYLPYKYVLDPNLADSFWTLRSVQAPTPIKEGDTTVKITVQPITQPAPGQVLLSLLFSDVPADKAAKVVAVGQAIQVGAADGSFSLTDDMMIGMALTMLFMK